MMSGEPHSEDSFAQRPSSSGITPENSPTIGHGETMLLLSSRPWVSHRSSLK